MNRICIGLLSALLLTSTGCVSRLFYHPTSTLYQTPARHQLRFEKVAFASRDGTRLSGWFIPAVGRPLGTVVHFHGNAQNMSAHFSYVDWLPAEGFNVFVFDYRGYGDSEGRPARKGIYEDCVSAIRYVRGRSDVDPERIVVFAQSLGAANAIVVLARDEPRAARALVVDSSFYSYRRIVRDKIGAIPVLALLKWPLSFIVVSNTYSPGNYVGRLQGIPLLFIHGTKDLIVPIEHSRDLYDRAPEPKSFWVVDGGAHADALIRFRDKYKDPLLKFFTDALATEPQGHR